MFLFPRNRVSTKVESLSASVAGNRALGTFLLPFNSFSEIGFVGKKLGTDARALITAKRLEVGKPLKGCKGAFNPKL